MKSKTVVIIPAYNEERNIEKVVTKTRKILKSKIVVVDDGSIDATAKKAKKAGAIVIKRKARGGKGNALRTGFQYFLKRPEKYVLIIDADMQYEPKNLKKILKPLLDDEADFVMGYRNFNKIPFRHKLGNLVWRTTFNLLFGTRLKDTNCGIMGMKKAALRKIKKIHGGYIIENAMLSDLVRAKLRIAQVPVRVRYDETSGVPRGVRVVGGVFLFILKEGIKYRLGS